MFDRNYNQLSFLNNKKAYQKSSLENNSENLYFNHENSPVKKENFKNIFLLSKKLKNPNNYTNKFDISNKILSKEFDDCQFNLSKLEIKNKAFKKNSLYKIENSNSIYIDKSNSKNDNLNITNINKDINIKENKSNKELYIIKKEFF